MPTGVDANLGRFPETDTSAEGADSCRRRDTAGLDVTGHADAAQFAFFGGGSPALFETVVFGSLHCRIEGGLKISRIIGHDDRRLVRELPNEVSRPQLGRTDTQFTRCGFHCPFDQIARFRASRATIGVDRRSVGVTSAHIAVDRRDIVLTRQQGCVQIGRNRRGKQRHIGAQIGDRVSLQGGYPVVLVKSDFDRRDMVAPMGVGHEAFGAIGHPFDRNASTFGRPQANDLFGVDENLRPEPAANVGRYDPQLVFRGDIVERAHDQPGDVWILARGPACIVIFGLVIVTQRRPRFHCVWHQPVVGDVHARHMGRCSDCLVDRGSVSDLPIVDQVALCLGMDLWRALFQRSGRIGDGLLFLIAYFHRFRRIAGLRPGVGHDNGHCFADKTCGGRRHRFPGAHVHRSAILGCDCPAADEVADTVGLDLLSGQHADDARHRFGRLGVDFPDRSVCMRAADERRMFHTGHDHVVGVSAGAGDKSLVFLARHPGADAFHTHLGFSSSKLASHRHLMPTNFASIVKPEQSGQAAFLALPFFCIFFDAARIALTIL